MKKQLSKKIYTIEDFIKFKKQIFTYCLKLENDLDRAQELYSKTSLDAVIYLKKTHMFDSDSHFINTMNSISRHSLLVRKKSAEVKNKQYHGVDLIEEQALEGKRFSVNPAVFASFETNLDLFMLMRHMSYFEKKVIYELYLGYSKEEITKSYKLSGTTLYNILDKLRKEPKKEPNKVDKRVLNKISNTKHRKMYSMYLNEVPFSTIAKKFKTSKSSIAVTINRINKNLKKDGDNISRRGQGAKR